MRIPAWWRLHPYGAVVGGMNDAGDAGVLGCVLPGISGEGCVGVLGWIDVLMAKKGELSLKHIV